MPKSKELISESDSDSESEQSEPETKQKNKSKKPEPKKLQQKPKKSKESDSASDQSDSDEGVKSKKRTKKNNDNKGPNKKAKKNDDGETSWELGNNKFVTVRNFKGKLLIDIREKYLDKNSGEMKPGKKGISLNVVNWNIFMDIFNEVNEEVKAQC